MIEREDYGLSVKTAELAMVIRVCGAELSKGHKRNAG